MTAMLEHLLPLKAVRPNQARFALGLWLIGLAATLILLSLFHGSNSHGESQAKAWIAVYSFILVFVWWLLPAGSLLLAMDSHRLRIPGAARQAFSSLPWFALACTLPAAFAFHMGGLSIWMSFLVLLTACAAGLLVAWLPRWLTMFVCMSPSIFNALHITDHTQMVSESTIHSLLVLLPALSFSIAIWTARRWIIHGIPEAGLKAPLIVQFRNGNAGWTGLGSKQELVMTAGWLQPTTQLRGSGPDDPVRSLRITLGGIFSPLQWIFYIKLLTAILAYAGIFMLAVAAGHRHHLLSFSFFRGFAYGVAWGTLPMLSSVSSLKLYFVVSRRWSDRSNDLALMALLPGLGQPANVRQSLLRVLLWTRPAWLVAATSVAMLALAPISPGSLHASGLFILLSLTCFTASVAGALHTISRAPPPGRLRTALAGVVAVLVFSLGYSTPLIVMGSGEASQTGAWTYPLIAVDIFVQLIAIGGLVRQAYRSWWRLLALPHPFLSR
ncbi:hypothetical protein ACYJW8_11820 [Frateuria aurantia]